MRKYITLFFMFIAVSSVVLCVPATSSAAPKGIDVSLDLATLTDSVTLIDFTSNAIVPLQQSNGKYISNFDAFKDKVSLSSGFALDIVVDDPNFYGCKDNFYITWKIYSSVPVNVLVSIQGPMESQGPGSKEIINWEVYVPDGSGRKSGTSLANPGIDYAAGEIIAHTSSLSDPGLCGSCPLAIKTEPLWDKTVKQYIGYIVATVKPA